MSAIIIATSIYLVAGSAVEIIVVPSAIANARVGSFSGNATNRRLGRWCVPFFFARIFAIWPMVLLGLILASIRDLARWFDCNAEDIDAENGARLLTRAGDILGCDLISVVREARVAREARQITASPVSPSASNP